MSTRLIILLIIGLALLTSIIYLLVKSFRSSKTLRNQIDYKQLDEQQSAQIALKYKTFQREQQVRIKYPSAVYYLEVEQGKHPNFNAPDSYWESINTQIYESRIAAQFHSKIECNHSINIHYHAFLGINENDKPSIKQKSYCIEHLAQLNTFTKQFICTQYNDIISKYPKQWIAFCRAHNHFTTDVEFVVLHKNDIASFVIEPVITPQTEQPYIYKHNEIEKAEIVIEKAKELEANRVKFVTEQHQEIRQKIENAKAIDTMRIHRNRLELEAAVKEIRQEQIEKEETERQRVIVQRQKEKEEAETRAREEQQKIQRQKEESERIRKEQLKRLQEEKERQERELQEQIRLEKKRAEDLKRIQLLEEQRKKMLARKEQKEKEQREQKAREEAERRRQEEERIRKSQELARQRAKEEEEEKLRQAKLKERQMEMTRTGGYKKDADAITQLLKDQNVFHFFHFTAAKNWAKIQQLGGLYSWADMEEMNESIPVPGGEELSRNLDKKDNLQNYVRLSFCDDHPMAFVVGQRTGEKMMLLGISTEVAKYQTTLFSNINAADSNAQRGNGLADLQKVDFNAVKQTYVKKTDPIFKLHQAEVLVKNFIPIKYIEVIKYELK